MRPLTYCPPNENDEEDLEYFHTAMLADQKLFEFDEDLYYELSGRGDALIEDALKKHMGIFYDKPLPYFKEIKSEYDYRLERKFKFENGNAPQFFIDEEEHLIIDLYNKLKSKQFSSVTNPVQKKYRETHDKKKAEFYDSAEYHSLRTEILDYNMHRFEKALEGAPSTKPRRHNANAVGYMMAGADVSGASFHITSFT